MLRIIATGIWLVALPARGQEFDAAWLKANYLPAAEKLEKAYSECTAEVSETVSNDKSDDYNRATYHFAYDGIRRKFDRTIVSHQGDTTYERSRTVVASPEVSFSIFTSQGKERSLQRVNRSALGFAQATKSIDRDACESIYAPFALLEKPVSRYLTGKDFEIKSVKREGARVRVDFHYTQDDKKDETQYDGWISFLPLRQWVIDRWEISLKVNKPTEYSCRMISALSYGDSGPVPVLAEWTKTTYGPSLTETDKLVVDKLTFASAPRSEFELSTYGFDDRIGMRPSTGRSLWFWLAVGGGACLLLAFAIRGIVVKRAAA